MTISEYISRVNQSYQLGNATEHTYRGALTQLIESILPDIAATNEPKRQSCGAPDYILTRKEIPVGFIEAKDIGDKDLEGLKKTGNKEQFDRYKASLSNLIFTDYLDFLFYQDGVLVTRIAIAQVMDNKIVPIPENFGTFESLIKNFTLNVGQTIRSPKKLAEMMAAKAKLLADVIEKSLTSDQINSENSSLKDQMIGFKDILIHDITEQGFADVYAQTICYGMFAARLHDSTLPTFSRQEAAELIPKSNPFLRKLFGYIAGPDIDDRILWIVDSLVEIFLACDVRTILSDYGKATKMEDPIIHFYETFLAEYDPKLRKARGVWYTPQPVVNFIVRAVDEILKTHFDLPQGLADTSKTTIKQIAPHSGKEVKTEIHKVQILDPAAGTGTFLAETVKLIHKKFEGQQGIWSKYVNDHLIPRLNGFELLIASYAMAHLKLDLLLTETGYKPTSNERLRIYLTNSLEESHPETGTLFASWLSAEANEANYIKRETPVMCVMGNPPYSVSSSNKSVWIEKLIKDYKQDLNERNIQPLSDDYIKFIKLGQHFIDKNGSGVLAYISNNSFLDGIIHRQMRKNLLETFDEIYILDLHGNAKKKEVCPDGSPDQNVFDIMQGVSINIFVKTGKSKIPNSKNELQNNLSQNSPQEGWQSQTDGVIPLAKVHHHSLQGKREYKYDYLKENTLESIEWNELEYSEPNYFFVPKDFGEIVEYEKGFKIDELFRNYASGIKTHRDNLVVDSEKQVLIDRLTNFFDNTIDDSSISTELKIKSNRDWDLNLARKDNFSDFKIRMVEYKPLDVRYIYYHKPLIDYGREDLMSNMNYTNLCLLSSRTSNDKLYKNIFITDKLSDIHTVSDQTYAFPLYIYTEPSDQNSLDSESSLCRPNLNPESVAQIEQSLGLRLDWTAGVGVGNVEEGLSLHISGDGSANDSVNVETGSTLLCFTPTDLLDYIYAMLHSPSYREKYKEFLKIDFPRVTMPCDKDKFWQLVSLGGELRQIHLLESPVVEQYITQYPVDGDNVVEKVRFEIENSPQEGWQSQTDGVILTMLNSENSTSPSKLGTPQEENAHQDMPSKEGGFGKVHINDTQYFDNVPEVAWTFYIGGYQPAQKWLKDRKGRLLEFDDILHYQKIVVALAETSRIMGEVDELLG